MKKICFVTGTRADYGIMAPIMKEVAKSPEARLQIIATNMHLSEDYGMTVKEIEADGFKVDKKIESIYPGGDAKATVISMAKLQEGLVSAYEELKPDLIVILGDRYEALASASAAVVYNIPIAHLHGGETTEGAIDDKFRHAITQLASMHFASTPQYAKKIISMGADAARVFHSGAPGAEGNYDNLENISQDFYYKTGLYPNEEFLLLAMHPVTVLPDQGEREIKEVLTALEKFIEKGYKVLITMPNSDPGTNIFTQLLKDWQEAHPKSVIAVKSLGSRLFHHAMENASAMVGNSSAALIEAPTYRLPAVNVGIRQKGRVHGLTVIDTDADREKIVKAIEAVLSLEMKSVIMGLSVASLNPYYKENSAEFIANKLLD